MATSGDIRDIMDLGHGGPRQQQPLKKKKKVAEHAMRLSGMSREVQALMGDSVPPVAIIENPKYKSKPSLAMKMLKVRHWEERPFVHAARVDGLVLQHWKRAIPGSDSIPAAATVDEDAMDDGRPQQTAELRFEDDFPSEKWNIQVNVVRYTQDQYEKHFKSEDWTKEETDYLLELCRQYDLRWILIADRYDASDIHPPTTACTAESESEFDPLARPAYPPRSMESLKARYYQISARMLELVTPASQMTNAEFQLWEKMRNFDAKAEITRKLMAEKLFERTKDEAEEERVLLEELHRITKNEEDFIKMRKDLYSRLETAPSLRRNERGEEQSAALYQSSHGLSILLSTLMAKERKLKRAVPNGEPASATSTPIDQKRPSGSYNRRETMDSQTEGPASTKKGSVSQPVIRTLTPAEQAKYGVSHPQERLTSGVMFRHEKINRITTAKSQVQTQKIQSALTELGIPPRLLMPTERVCREFERLVAEVQLLLDARRGLEKVVSEVKVLEEHKRIRLGEDRVPAKSGTDAMDVDDPDASGNQNPVVKTEGSAAESGLNADETIVEDSKILGDEEEEEEEEDDDDDEEDEVDQSQVNEDNENGDADEDDVEAVNEDEEDNDVDDAPGLEDLEKANEVTDDDEEDEEDADDDDGEGDEDDEEEEDDEVNASDEDVEQDEENGDAEVDESITNGQDADAEDADEDGDVSTAEPNRPVSSHRSHKRSASVISEASKTGSNRSGFGRKKRR